MRLGRLCSLEPYRRFERKLNSYWLWLEDPFDPSDNPARSVRHFAVCSHTEACPHTHVKS